MKKATLIDGALGFTGGHLVDYCLSQGDTVVATDVINDKNRDVLDNLMSRNANYADNNLIFIKSDLTNKTSLDALYHIARNEGMDLKEAYHVAAIFDMSASKDALQRVNVDGTENFCKSAKENDLERVIYVSTASIYGHIYKGIKIPERVGFEDTGPYPKSKHQGELIHASYNQDGPKCLIARPGLKIGPGSRYGAIVLLAAVCNLGLIPTVGTGKDLGQAATTYLNIYNDVAAMRHLIKSENLFQDRVVDSNDVAYNIADRHPEMGLTQEELVLRAHEWKFGHSFFQNSSRAFQKRIPKSRSVVSFLANVNDFARKSIGFPALLEPDSVEYFLVDHIFDTDKLAGTGFQWVIPDSMQGVYQTLRWCEQNNWPGLEKISWSGLAGSIVSGMLKSVKK